MPNYEHDSPALGRIHERDNDAKYFCHLTGFLQGVAASGYLEVAEIEPLLAECFEFVERVSDHDARDIIDDFRAELLDFDTIFACAEFRATQIDPENEKSALNRFLGFCRGVVCDGKITIQEAEAIVEIIDRNEFLLKTVGVGQILISCIDAIEDGIVTELESIDICTAIGEIVGDCYGDTGIANPFGVANFPETRLSSLDEDLIDRIVVFTGNFRTSPRTLLEARLEALGVAITKHVSGSTHFLIVGGECSRDWIEMNRGTKMRKAQELRLKSPLPHFISEAQLLRLLG